MTPEFWKWHLGSGLTPEFWNWHLKFRTDIWIPGLVPNFGKFDLWSPGLAPEFRDVHLNSNNDTWISGLPPELRYWNPEIPLGNMIWNWVFVTFVLKWWHFWGDDKGCHLRLRRRGCWALWRRPQRSCWPRAGGRWTFFMSSWRTKASVQYSAISYLLHCETPKAR